MLKARTRHFLFILIALVVGAGLGALVYQFRMRAIDKQAHSQIKLRVLALRGVFRPSFLRKLETEKQIKIELTEANDPEALWDLFDAPSGTPYDIVSLLSYQVPPALQMTRLAALSASTIDWQQVSSDFRIIPGDVTRNHAMPILWGLPGMLYRTDKFEEPPDSWTQVFEEKTHAGKIGILRSPIGILTWINDSKSTNTSQEEIKTDSKKTVKPSSSKALKAIAKESNRTATREAAKEASRDESSDVGPSEQDISQDLKPILKRVKLSQSSLSSQDLIDRDDAAEKFDVIQITAADFESLSPSQKQGWTFVLPQKSSALWILSLAVTSDSKLQAESQMLLKDLLESDFASLLSESSHQSSALNSVEKSKLAAVFKPSFVKQIPLTKIQMEHDFLGARVVHAALEGESVTTSSTSE